MCARLSAPVTKRTCRAPSSPARVAPSPADGVSAATHAFESRTASAKTLVIFDEVHHAGDALSWGEASAQAFALATRRLALTGTPFRTDANPIPFVRYVEDADGTRKSVADYTYGYAEALRCGWARSTPASRASAWTRPARRCGSVRIQAVIGE